MDIMNIFLLRVWFDGRSERHTYVDVMRAVSWSLVVITTKYKRQCKEGNFNLKKSISE